MSSGLFIMNKKLLMVFVLAFFIRLINLDQSLWLDEAVTANVVKNYGFDQIINRFSPADFHPPLYYLLTKIWTAIFGYSEVSLRFPSVIFSMLAGFLVYKIARYQYGGMVGFWGAVFFLFNPLIVYYSQEARMYMMVTFLLTGSLYFYLRLNFKFRTQNSEPQTKAQKYTVLSLFIFLAVLSFYTFYGAIFLIVPMIIYFIHKRQYKFFFVSLLFFIFSLLIISPLLYQQLTNAKENLVAVVNWRLVLGTASLKNLFLIPIKFSVGRISFYPKWFYWLTAGVWTAIVFFFIIKGGIDKYKSSEFEINPLLIFFAGSLLLGFVFSFFSPLLQYFRFLYLLSIMSLLLGRGQAGAKLVLWKWITGAGFILLSLIYLLDSQFHREDWKSLSKILFREKKVYMIESSSDPLKYYLADIQINDLKKIGQKITDNRIIVIPYTTQIYSIDYKRFLEKQKFKEVKKMSFRGVTVEFWKRQ